MAGKRAKKSNAEDFPVDDLEDLSGLDEDEPYGDIELEEDGDEGRRGIPGFVIAVLFVMIIVIPAIILASQLTAPGSGGSYSYSYYRSDPGPSPGPQTQGMYEAGIRDGDSNNSMAADYHKAAMANFSPDRYDDAIDQFSLAANYSQRSADSYESASKYAPDGGKKVLALYIRNGALKMLAADAKYADAARAFAAGDGVNGTSYRKEADSYLKQARDYLSPDHYYL